MEKLLTTQSALIAIGLISVIAFIAGMLAMTVSGELGKARKQLILKLLDNGGEMIGLKLIEQSNGKLKRGSIYRLLNELVEEEAVTSRPQESFDPRIGMRSLYAITDTGKRRLAKIRETLKATQESTQTGS